MATRDRGEGERLGRSHFFNEEGERAEQTFQNANWTPALTSNW